jgi:regulator of protease activity HflC (stomatin/prohibitin superfamily)
MSIAVRRKLREQARKVGPEKNRAAEPSRAQVVAQLYRFFNPFSVLLLVVSVVTGVLAEQEWHLLGRPGFTFLAWLLVGIYLLFAVKIARQWERGVVLRFGKFHALAGPGLYWVVPIVDSVSHLVDQRVRVTDVTAESALTRDTVPVNVDAIVFWLVWDAKKSVLEVASYFDAIALSAQTALREAIGRHMLAEMITEREALGKELQHILDEKTNPWGITVQSVEIRDVRIPRELEDAMSRQAQAERERQARIILGTAETEISKKFLEAGNAYTGHPVALHLRAMNMLYEALKEKGSMVIVPSSAVETMGLGGLLGTVSAAPEPPALRNGGA